MKTMYIKSTLLLSALLFALPSVSMASTTCTAGTSTVTCSATMEVSATIEPEVQITGLGNDIVFDRNSWDAINIFPATPQIHSFCVNSNTLDGGYQIKFTGTNQPSTGNTMSYELQNQSNPSTIGTQGFEYEVTFASNGQYNNPVTTTNNQPISTLGAVPFNNGVAGCPNGNTASFGLQFLNLRAQTGNGLTVGTYSDTLTVTVTPN